MQYTRGEIIDITFEHKSFSWADGRYVVLEQVDNELRMCRMDENGKLETFEDGRYMVSCTGAGNKGITKTNQTHPL